MKFRALLAAAAVVLAHFGAAVAGQSPQAYGLSEFRAGAMMDDVELHGPPSWIIPVIPTISVGNLDTASFDLLFRSPDVGAFEWIGSPRPVVGVDLDMRHESMVHAALNWHWDVPKSQMFIEGELGGAIHNGALSGATPPFRNLGCRELFYWSINIGYKINDHWDIMATEQHASQDGICGWDNNQGLNYDGIRVGYRF
jgi:lipid A 3-O-deacylase